MPHISLPYGQTKTTVYIPDENFAGELLPSSSVSAISTVSAPESQNISLNAVDKNDLLSSDDLILNALENPIGSPRLRDILTPEKTVAVIINDVTRPTPSKYILSFLLQEIETANVPDKNIKIFFALGLHRAQSEEECLRLVGNEI